MTPPTLPPELAGVTIVRQAGVGRAVTDGGVYPLGAMDFAHAPNGRGLVSFKAGAGALELAGGEADETGPGQWRLRIDRAALVTVQPARGSCDLVQRVSPPGYVSLHCDIRLGDDPRPVTVEWRGDGSPSYRVR